MTGTMDMRWMHHSLRWATALAAVVALLLMLPNTAGAQDPTWNNGTVKVDEAPFDDHPNNEPHVGCVFQSDLYGYDEGDLNADVTIEAHPMQGHHVRLTINAEGSQGADVKHKVFWVEECVTPPEEPSEGPSGEPSDEPTDEPSEEPSDD